MALDPLVKRSKRLSYLLRHNPGDAGLTLDGAGWTPVADLLNALGWSRADLDVVVADNNKKRFEYDPTGARIRASQGHSVDVDLGYEAKEPPTTLYHGTSEPLLAVILTDGLLKMQRHHVHLSPDTETALVVARRRPKPVVLAVDAARMIAAGSKFYLSTNGVWLVDAVPARYLSRLP